VSSLFLSLHFRQRAQHDAPLFLYYLSLWPGCFCISVPPKTYHKSTIYSRHDSHNAVHSEQYRASFMIAPACNLCESNIGCTLCYDTSRCQSPAASHSGVRPYSTVTVATGQRQLRCYVVTSDFSGGTRGWSSVQYCTAATFVHVRAIICAAVCNFQYPSTRRAQCAYQSRP
jgi:hypothetical protein